MGGSRALWTEHAGWADAGWAEAGQETAEEGAAESYEGRRGRRVCGVTDT